MVKIATIVSFLTAPFYAILNYLLISGKILHGTSSRDSSEDFKYCWHSFFIGIQWLVSVEFLIVSNNSHPSWSYV